MILYISIFTRRSSWSPPHRLGCTSAWHCTIRLIHNWANEIRLKHLINTLVTNRNYKRNHILQQCSTGTSWCYLLKFMITHSHCFLLVHPMGDRWGTPWRDWTRDLCVTTLTPGPCIPTQYQSGQNSTNLWVSWGLAKNIKRDAWNWMYRNTSPAACVHPRSARSEINCCRSRTPLQFPSTNRVTVPLLAKTNFTRK